MSRIKVLCLRLLSLVILCPVLGAAQVVSISPDDGRIIRNPERGLAKLFTVGPESTADITAMRGDNHTIAWGLIDLGAFTHVDVIPDSKIIAIQNWFTAVRTAKLKTVVRVVYHKQASFTPTPPDAVIATQLAHLQQLSGTVFDPNGGVVL